LQQLKDGQITLVLLSFLILAKLTAKEKEGKIIIIISYLRSNMPSLKINPEYRAGNQEILPDERVAELLFGPPSPERDKAFAQLSYFLALKVVNTLVGEGKISKNEGTATIRKLLEQEVSSLPAPDMQTTPINDNPTMGEE
jgi:hypothetical protein